MIKQEIKNGIISVLMINEREIGGASERFVFFGFKELPKELIGIRLNEYKIAVSHIDLFHQDWYLNVAMGPIRYIPSSHINVKEYDQQCQKNIAIIRDFDYLLLPSNSIELDLPAGGSMALDFLISE